MSPSPAFRVMGGTVRSCCHAKVSAPRLESKAVARERLLPLFSEVFPTLLLEIGHVMEVKLQRRADLPLRSGLRLSVEIDALPLWGKSCPTCSHEYGSCSASCPWLLCTLEATEITCLNGASHPEAGVISLGCAVSVSK